MSLTRRFLWIIGAEVLACALAATVAAVFITREQVQARTSQRANEVVSRSSVAVEMEFRQLSVMARNLGRDPMVRELLAPASEELGHWSETTFDDYLADDEFLEILDSHGHIVYSSRDAYTFWQVPVREGLHLMRPSSHSLLPRSLGAGVPVLIGASEVHGPGGALLGRVLVGRPLTGSMLDQVEASTGYSLVVWGPDGSVLASGPGQQVPCLADLVDPSSLSSLAAGQTLVRRLGATSGGMTVCLWAMPREAGTSTAAYFAAVVPGVGVESMDWVGVVAVGLLALGSVVLNLVLLGRAAGRVERDMALLIRSAEAIGHGRLDQRVATGSMGELRCLGDAFNTMAVRLQEAQDELVGSEERLLSATIATRRAYEDALGSLAAALDTRDNETREHSYRVMEFALRIAREMDLDDEEMVYVERGALLHDIGKIGIPDSILLKPNQLSVEEWSIMKEHPRIGFAMLASVEFLSKAAEIVYSHHERWDGQGYPRGLEGEEIPIGARIFSVVDAFDAITSDRPYRKAMGYDSAREMIVADAGKQFDPQVVEAFCRVSEEEWDDLRRQVTDYVNMLRERASGRIVDFDVQATRQVSPTKANPALERCADAS